MNNCLNCNKYPFCERENNNGCDNWIKRDRTLKLEKVENKKFEFKEIK